MRIISERATKDKARRVLLADLSSTDPVIRNKAIKTMHVLLEDRSRKITTSIAQKAPLILGVMSTC